MTELRGKRIVVTGATTGLGRVTARELGRMGAEIVLVARDREKADATLAELRAVGAPAAHALIADLSLMSSVRTLADETRKKFDRIDVLVNNAGAVFGSRGVTAEGFERTFALNHLAYFLLSHLLLDRIKERIVNVASEAHRGGRLDFDDLQSEKRYSPLRVYGTTKLENLLFTFELARRLEGRGITVNAAHPGFVASGFGTTDGWLGALMPLGRLFALSAEEGARTQIWLASSPEVAGVTGKYFAKQKEKRPTKAALDVAAQKRLWEVTEKLLGITS
jgi:NAD(P)-dependent dehydrogenase (short-subunit alcohol dehydrogenase family)